MTQPTYDAAYLDAWLAGNADQPDGSFDLEEMPHAVVALPDGHVGTPYGLKGLHNLLEELDRAPVGTRNDTLNRVSFSVGALVAGGHLDQATSLQIVEETAHAIGLQEAEIRKTMASGFASGTKRPRVAKERTEDTWARSPIPYAPESATPGSAAAPGETATGSAPAAARDALRRSAVEAEAEQLRVRREARRLVDAEDSVKAFREPPYRPSLTAELLIPDEPVTYRIADLLPTGGNVLLTAQFKAGKTTLVNNLARALADGEPFLGRYDVTAPSGRVALFNYEVDERMYRAWLRSTGIANTDGVAVLNLRGYRMPLEVPHVEDWVVRWLIEQQAEVWVVDPFARAFGGVSENDNAEVGRFLDTLDVIKHRAGVSELVLPTHTGRGDFEQGAEHARGATRLDDWADVRWFLAKDEAETRYFRATGRDVEVAESKLTFDQLTRRLRIGGGDRQWEAKRRAELCVLLALQVEDGMSAARLYTAMRGLGAKGRDDILKVSVDSAARGGYVRVEEGGKGEAIRHWLTPAGCERLATTT